MGRAGRAEPGCVVVVVVAAAAGTASPQSEFPPPPGSGLRRSRPAVIEALGEEGGTEGGTAGAPSLLCVQVARPRGGHGGAGPAPVLLRDRDQQGAR